MLMGGFWNAPGSLGQGVIRISLGRPFTFQPERFENFYATSLSPSSSKGACAPCWVSRSPTEDSLERSLFSAYSSEDVRTGVWQHLAFQTELHPRSSSLRLLHPWLSCPPAIWGWQCLPSGGG